MGEIADAMINGECCSLCGQYFLDEDSDTEEIFSHGHPVVCKECWTGLTSDEKKQYTRATAETL